MRPLICIGLLWFLLGSPLQGQFDAPTNPIISGQARVAIISTEKTANLASLLTTELSSDPKIALVERDEISKIGDERKVEEMAGSDPAALGKLISADGLLFLDQISGGTEVRLTAVGLGYAVFDEQIASDSNPSQLAKSLAHLVSGYARKLKLDPDKAIPISILNLHSELPSEGSLALERNLTLLLESQLASLPSFVVLERRHAWSLGFEHSITQNAKPILHGSYVLDGSLSQPFTNVPTAELQTRIQLKSPSNQKSIIEVSGSTNDLTGMAVQLADKIQKSIGISTNEKVIASWQSQEEAREYLKEGIWTIQNNGLTENAIQALDAAELLGETAPDLLASRIRILLGTAEQGIDLNLNADDIDPLPSGSPTLDQRTDKTIEAIKDSTRYRDENMESKLQIYKWNEDLDIRSFTFLRNLSMLSCKLLVYLDEAKSPRAKELRHALRSITGYDPLHGKLGVGFFAYRYLQRDIYQDEWADSPEEEMAYYHLLCASPNEYLAAIGYPLGFCSRFVKSPEEQSRLYNQLLQTSKNDPSSKLAYLLLMANSKDEVAANVAYKDALKELWRYRDDLVSGKWLNFQCLPEKFQKENAAQLLPLLHYYLVHAKTSGRFERDLDFLWHPESWSESDANTIWPEYLDYKNRLYDEVRIQHSNLDYFADAFDRYEEPVFKMFPHLSLPVLPSSKALVPKLLWTPWGSADDHSVRITISGSDIDGDNLYLVAATRTNEINTTVYKIHLPDVSVQQIAVPERMNPRQLTLIADGFYINYYAIDPTLPSPIPDRVARYDSTNKKWTIKAIGIPSEGPSYIGNDVYLDGDGLFRYDWDSGAIKLLCSKRRKPALNQFDNQIDRISGGVFSGPSGNPCFITLSGVYYIKEQPGKWPEVFHSDDYFIHYARVQNKTLVYSLSGDIVLIDPLKPEPQFLMSASPPLFSKSPSSNKVTGRRKSTLSERTLWDALPRTNRSNGQCIIGVGMTKNHLFLLEPPIGKKGLYELLVYTRDHGRNPSDIVLKFDMEGSSALDPTTPPSKEHFGAPGLTAMMTAKSGLCFVSQFQGIWFLSFKSIDAYLKSHPPAEPTSVPPIANQTPNPSPQKTDLSKPVGDQLDPGFPAGSFR